MGRILLATIGSLGDLHPLIAIAIEMRRRGHLVRFCTSETYRAKIESLGFGFDALRPDATPENEEVAHLVREIMDPWKGVERLLRGWVLPMVRESYADLLRAVEGPPRIDLLACGELVYPAPLVAEKLGIAWASCITAPMSFFSAHDPPVLPPVPKLSALLRKLGPRVNAASIRLVKLSTQRWGEPVRALRAELGLPPGLDPVHEGKFSPHLVLAMFSPVLGPPQSDWPVNTVATGFPFYDGPPGQDGSSFALSEFLDQGDPPIVFTLGSSAVLDPGEFYAESAVAAARLGRRAVLLTGRNPPPENLPETTRALGYARFSELFPRAAAIVHQGGAGTTGQAMLAGRPMLVMPFNFDQPDNAARIARLGLGETIGRRSYTSRRAAEHLENILAQSRYQDCASRVSQLVRRENGAGSAADALERLLH